MIPLDEVKIKIKDLAEKYHLSLVVLFGSQAKGRAIKESDIDIGVFRKSGLTLDEQAVLNKEFSELFKNNNIDIKIISPNNPLLMYNILKHGKILYEKERGLADRLRLYSWKLAAESKTFRDRSFSSLKHKIASL
jgi:predicted nucleotidyltransferase